MSSAKEHNSGHYGSKKIYIKLQKENYNVSWSDSLDFSDARGKMCKSHSENNLNRKSVPRNVLSKRRGSIGVAGVAQARLQLKRRNSFDHSETSTMPTTADISVKDSEQNEERNVWGHLATERTLGAVIKQTVSCNSILTASQSEEDDQSGSNTTRPHFESLKLSGTFHDTISKDPTQTLCLPSTEKTSEALMCLSCISERSECSVASTVPPMLAPASNMLMSNYSMDQSMLSSSFLLNSADMAHSVELLDNIEPPSMMSSVMSYNSRSPTLIRKSINMCESTASATGIDGSVVNKCTGVMEPIGRQTKPSEMHDSMLDSMSNLQFVKPPSYMDELDMENSLFNLDSIISDEFNSSVTLGKLSQQSETLQPSYDVSLDADATVKSDSQTIESDTELCESEELPLDQTPIYVRDGPPGRNYQLGRKSWLKSCTSTDPISNNNNSENTLSRDSSYTENSSQDYSDDATLTITDSQSEVLETLCHSCSWKISRTLRDNQPLHSNIAKNTCIKNESDLSDSLKHEPRNDSGRKTLCFDQDWTLKADGTLNEGEAKRWKQSQLRSDNTTSWTIQRTQNNTDDAIKKDSARFKWSGTNTSAKVDSQCSTKPETFSSKYPADYQQPTEGTSISSKNKYMYSSPWTNSSQRKVRHVSPIRTTKTSISGEERAEVVKSNKLSVYKSGFRETKASQLRRVASSLSSNSRPPSADRYTSSYEESIGSRDKSLPSALALKRPQSDATSRPLSGRYRPASADVTLWNRSESLGCLKYSSSLNKPTITPVQSHRKYNQDSQQDSVCSDSSEPQPLVRQGTFTLEKPGSISPSGAEKRLTSSPSRIQQVPQSPKKRIPSPQQAIADSTFTRAKTSTSARRTNSGSGHVPSRTAKPVRSTTSVDTTYLKSRPRSGMSKSPSCDSAMRSLTPRGYRLRPSASSSGIASGDSSSQSAEPLSSQDKVALSERPSLDVCSRNARSSAFNRLNSLWERVQQQKGQSSSVATTDNRVWLATGREGGRLGAQRVKTEARAHTAIIQPYNYRPPTQASRIDGAGIKR